MQKWYINSDAVWDDFGELSPERELYTEQMESADLKVSCVDEEAITIFNDMPEITLPPLPWGYLWARHDDEHLMIRDTASYDCKMHLILYGPNKASQINFLFQTNSVTTYSFAHIQRGSAAKRSDPMTTDDYRVPGFDYSNVKYNQHVRGHLIDLRDTIKAGPRELWSCSDPRNFVPEPPIYEWGLGIRNQKVQALRRVRGDTAYAQHTLYPDRPLETANGTCVPEEVYFTSFSVNGQNYKRLDSINVSWDEDMKRPRGQKILEHASKELTTSLEASPVVQEYLPESSDRALRYQSREHRKMAENILHGDVKARFWSAELFLRNGAADREFESADNKLLAGITADKVGRTMDAIDNVNRALDFGEELAELDESDMPISKKVFQQGKSFIKSKQKDDDWGDEDLDDITDRLKAVFRP